MRKIFLLVLMSSSVSMAGVCEIYVERTACPGKEADSFVKCGGKASCSSKKASDSEDDCKKKAEEDCSNSRLEITKSKIVKYTFAGKQSGNVCAADRPDFNKCK